MGKIVEHTEVGEELRIPTEDARKALGHLWSSLRDDKLEIKDMLVVVILIVSIIGMIASFF